MSLIKMEWTQLAYTDYDISEVVLDFIFSKIQPTDLCVFVNPINLVDCLYLENYKQRKIFYRKIIVRVFPDSKLKIDEWVVRTRQFEIHVDGA